MGLRSGGGGGFGRVVEAGSPPSRPGATGMGREEPAPGVGPRRPDDAQRGRLAHGAGGGGARHHRVAAGSGVQARARRGAGRARNGSGSGLACPGRTWAAAAGGTAAFLGALAVPGVFGRLNGGCGRGRGGHDPLPAESAHESRHRHQPTGGSRRPNLGRAGHEEGRAVERAEERPGISVSWLTVRNRAVKSLDAGQDQSANRFADRRRPFPGGAIARINPGTSSQRTGRDDLGAYRDVPEHDSRSAPFTVEPKSLGGKPRRVRGDLVRSVAGNDAIALRAALTTHTANNLIQPQPSYLIYPPQPHNPIPLPNRAVRYSSHNPQATIKLQSSAGMACSTIRR